MKKFFETESDLHVRKEVVFLKETHDGYGYADPECTVKVPSADLENAFNMGTLVAVDGAGETRVTKLVKSEGYVTVFYIKATTVETTTTLAEVAINGAEYSAE